MLAREVSKRRVVLTTVELVGADDTEKEREKLTMCPSSSTSSLLYMDTATGHGTACRLTKS